MRIGRYELAANVSLLFAEHAYGERFAAARAAGFTAVESWWPFPSAAPGSAEVDGLLRAVDEAGVRLVGLNFFAGDMPAGERGVLSDPDRVAEFEASLAVIERVHDRTGCPAFNALYGQRRDGVTPEDQDACALRNLRTARDALPDSATILLEALADGQNGAYPLATCDGVAAVLDRTGPGVALLFDTFHLASNDENLVACIEKHGSRIGHVQLADAPGRNEPGTGAVDFPAVFTALEANGYTGVLAAEYRPRADTAAGLGWIERF
jgi:hydroxypyruvate isomerase